ncbi:unnamed protein product [Prunus armeniaca]
MAAEGSFVQPAIPKFDGHYDHWSMLMENFLRSKEFWSLVEEGIPVPEADGSGLTTAQKKTIEDQKLKDLKVKNYLFQTIDRNIMETILVKDTAKQIWDSMKLKYQGSTRVKRAQLQALRRTFEVLQMKEGEGVDEYFARTLTIVNKMKIHGEKMDQVVIIEKILRSMTPKFDYVVCSVEESNNLDTLTIDELQSSLLVHEQRMKGHGQSNEEQALKVTYEDRAGGRGRGRGTSRGRGRGRGRQEFNKALVECYKCHKLGHFQYECPSWEKAANYAEADAEADKEEEVLLMAHVELNDAKREGAWFLDSGCSNHMSGNKQWFVDFDEKFRHSVKLGNNSRMPVMGRGNIKLEIGGIIQVVTNVFYIPELTNNLLSVGQLQEKGLAILIQDGACRIYHPRRGLIAHTQMTANRMFVLLANANIQSSSCLQVAAEDITDLWHRRYGHLNNKGLRTLHYKQLVKGLPKLKAVKRVCTICNIGKQHREAIPKKSQWRASQKLQLIHADICGPITPSSNSNKRQLTATYTPQQNGVAERKNRTIMNMVRCLLTEKQMPKVFWPEAVRWTVHVLNRSPTAVVKGKTPEECWSGIKPTVDYFRVWGCIRDVHVPDTKRSKLDDKSYKCVLLRYSDESKAYRLFDPIAKKIVISRDLVFDEGESWNWKRSEEEVKLDVLDWGDDDYEDDEHDLSDSDEDEESAEGNQDELSVQTDSYGGSEESSSSSSPSGPRVRRAPSWMQDYESGEGLSEEEDLQNFALFTSQADPTYYEEAAKWRNAMDLEIEAIVKNKTWELAYLPVGAKKIGVKWVYKTKFNESGEVDKCKARLVAKGYAQEHGIDYNEVFAPVALWDTIRMVLALAAQKGWLVFQLDPQGYEQKGKEEKVFKLKKALYGLKQAPRAWYSKIENYFLNEGFERCSHESTLFVKTKAGGKILIVSLYVDDLIFTGNDACLIEEFKCSMKSKFEMTDLGKMRYFLGVEVLQSSKGIHLCQKKYAKDVLDRFGMRECNSVKNPIVPGSKLTREGGGKKVDATQFKQLVGSLMYLTATRPDLMYSVCLISRYMADPTEEHLLAAKRVLRYLKGTLELGVFYAREGAIELFAYTDSDYAGDYDDRKSTSGYVFKLSGGAVAWASKKQPVVTLSTT